MTNNYALLLDNSKMLYLKIVLALFYDWGQFSTLKSYNSAYFKAMVTNKISKSKLKFYLSNDVSFIYFWLLNNELQVVKAVYIFWDTL